MKRGVFFLLFIILAQTTTVRAQIITTFAGGGSLSVASVPPATAAFTNGVTSGAFDKYGNYYCETQISGNTVLKVNTAGYIFKVAGSGATAFSGDGGPATLAGMFLLNGVTVDTAGNLYIADYGSSRIRKVDAHTGYIATFAGNGIRSSLGDLLPATAASLVPEGVSADKFGNIYVLDSASRVRKIDASGIITTVAGNGIGGFSGDGGPATNAEILEAADGLCTDAAGNVYIGCYGRVRKVNVSTGIITTIAGNGIDLFAGDGMHADSAQFDPYDITVDLHGNLYIGSVGTTDRVFQVDTANIFRTIAGNGINGYNGDGGLADTSELFSPGGLVTDTCGNLYIADPGNKRVRKVTFNPACGVIPITITGTTNVCVGATIALTGSYAGGAWSSSSPGHATIGSGSGIVTGVATGTTVITYTLGSTIAIKTVTVFPAPVAGSITGTASLCAGSSISLSESSSGGVWSSGSMGVASIGTTGVVSGSSAGVALISYSVTNSCGTAMATKSVTINPLPVAATITGLATVCVESSSALSDTVPGGIWSSGAASIALISGTGLVTGVSVGSALISYSVTNSCGSAITTIALTVYPLPDAGAISGNDSICLGDTTLLVETDTGGIWNSNNTVISSVNASGSVTGINAGADTIRYTVTDADYGCSATTTFPLTVSLCNESVNQLNESIDAIKIAPNPAKNIIMITGTAKISSVTINNILGQTVYTNVFNDKNVQVNITALPPGVYVVKVNGSYVQKLIKQ